MKKKNRNLEGLVICNVQICCFLWISLFRYPKDAEKHLLAVKSGLTRSQVLAVYDKSLNGECIVQEIL